MDRDFMQTRARRTTLTSVLAAAALGACAAAGASAQSTLAEGSCVVVTQAGVFLVPEGEAAIQVFDTTPFGGGAMEVPSITWITGTDSFVVTRRDLSGKGGLWRVELAPDGTGSVTDLTTSVPAGIGRDFTDSDYSVGLDTLFVIEHGAGTILAAPAPATSTGAALAPWAAIPAGTGVSIAVRGAAYPFSMLVVKETGELVRVSAAGIADVNAAGNPSLTQVATDPIVGTWFVASQTKDMIAIGAPDTPSGLPTALISLNVWQVCGPLVQEPLDIVWDGRARRVVGLAGDFMLPCVAGEDVAGKNHILRLPFTAFGPPGAQPVLLTTSTGLSGITGVRGDLALVRHALADITWHGTSGSHFGTSVPVFGGGDPGIQQPLLRGEPATLGVAGAPPSAAATLVIGLSAIDATHQGQLFGPHPELLLHATTGADGMAQITLAVPLATPPGTRAFMQWWFDDTTTPAAGDLSSSQVGVFTVGRP
jgi:hypothetical protein